MGRWRDSRLGLGVAGLALLAAAPGLAAAAGVQNRYALVAAAAVAAVVVAVAVVWQERFRRRAQHRDERDLQIEDGCLVLAGRLPRIREITDLRKLGVHRAATLSRAMVKSDDADGATEHLPAYVPRDFDQELRERIAAGGFVLLVGDSTAGKSRAAAEAMIATLADHVLIAPERQDAVSAAVDKAERTANCVLWIDDLEGFVGPGGLTRSHITRLTAPGKHHHVILATLRAVEAERLTTSITSDGDAARSVNEISDVLEQAHRIDVPRLFSMAERERTKARNWDPRLSEALGHSSEYGVAEYLAAGPQLWDAWQNAWHTAGSNDSHVRGAALVDAAIDIRRAGYTAGIPRQLLDEVHEPYIAARVGPHAEPEALEHAWSWATKRRRATTAILTGTEGDRVEVFDYLVDRVQRDTPAGDHVADAVIRATLEHANAADQANIGSNARAQGRYTLAHHAWSLCYRTRAEELGPEHLLTLLSRNNLAQALSDLGRWDEAEAELRALCETQVKVLGPKHLDTLLSRNALGYVLSDLRRWDEAEAELRAVCKTRTDLLGTNHRDTLISRNNLALALGGLGRWDEAEIELRAVCETQVEVLGPRHLDTLLGRSNLALALSRLGRWDEAEAEQRALYETHVQVLGPEHPYSLISRNNLASVLGGLGRWDEAEAELRAVYETHVEVLGPRHPHTLISGANLAATVALHSRQRKAPS
jgi:tetratricopeptide (TPR) repeat protein